LERDSARDSSERAGNLKLILLQFTLRESSLEQIDFHSYCSLVSFITSFCRQLLMPMGPITGNGIGLTAEGAAGQLSFPQLGL
jgi:hypothetical protein